ncbi:MAG: hypothetical protein V2J24_18730 [Pseudomonadales bacterium]|jgi:hypothetical protein|nr:hypothetical protein [Pseudomonadales bacterium]
MADAPDRRERFAALYDPIVAEIERRAAVTDRYLDREAFRILLATVWANVVLDPADGDIEDADLEPFHDYLNERAREILGEDDAVRASFRFLLSPAGEAACARTRIPAAHRKLLERIGLLILDPHGIESAVRRHREG